MNTLNSNRYLVSVYFPLTTGGEYGTIYFVGGLNTLVLAEFYSIYLRKVASHGFYVFGVDYDYPLYSGKLEHPSLPKNVGQDIEIYFKELEFVCLKTTTFTLNIRTPKLLTLHIFIFTILLICLNDG